MSRIDDVIADVGYILDSLIAYRMITKTGNCNQCIKRDCKYRPLPGEVVRYNCPFLEVRKTDGS